MNIYSLTNWRKTAYEFVRDNISHAADINEETLTCSASQVF